MKVLLSWLREMAPLDASPAEIADALGMLGTPVEEMVELGKGLDGIVVARVLELRQHRLPFLSTGQRCCYLTVFLGQGIDLIVHTFALRRSACGGDQLIGDTRHSGYNHDQRLLGNPACHQSGQRLDTLGRAHGSAPELQDTQ